METLSWDSLATGPDQQAADFTGKSWTSDDGSGAGSGAVVVEATLLPGSDVYSNADINPTAVIYYPYTYTDSDLLNTGEVHTGGNYNGGAGGDSALVLRNLEVDNSSGAGLTHTVSLQLDFSTNDAANYAHGVEDLGFWISSIDSGVGIDQVQILAYDLEGELLPAGAITFPSVGSNVAVDNSTPSALLNSNGGTANVASATGAAQVSIAGPVSQVVIVYNNLGTGSQVIAISDLSFETSPADASCYAKGTLISTARGEIPVESLVEGDLVVTSGNGLQPVRWVGHRSFAAKGGFAPICISKGTLGNTRDLLVSPAHRMVVSDARIEALFSENAVLVPAKSLVDGDRIYRKTGGTVTYYHILFDAHEVIFAEGAPSESMFLSDSKASLSGFAKAAEAELLAIFPELNGALPTSGPVARPVLNQAEAALLLN